MKTKIGLFFGGNSVEHEISIISALQAYNVIDKEKYDVIPIYINKENEMYVGNEIGKIENYSNVQTLIERSQRVILVYDHKQVRIVKYPFKLFSRVYDTLDLALPIVHGLNIEDGTLVSLFKMVNLPYVGSNVLSSAIGMDKQIMKDVLKEHDLPVLDYLTFNTKDYNEGVGNIVRESLKKFGYPLMVKPANLGSSVGITKVNNEKDFVKAIDYAFTFTNKIIVERCVVKLREINCSVLGNYEESIASECEEPVLSSDILSYEDKYMNKGSKSKGMSSLKRKLPADISKEMKKTIQDLAIKTFNTLGCSGVARIDFLLEGNKVYVNEINTIPGSLSYYLWQESGISYTELLDRLIKISLKEQKDNEKIMSSFETNILETLNENTLKNGGKK